VGIDQIVLNLYTTDVMGIVGKRNSSVKSLLLRVCCGLFKLIYGTNGKNKIKIMTLFRTQNIDKSTSPAYG